MSVLDSSRSSTDYLPGGRLKRLIGKPRSSWSPEDLAMVARNQGVKTISLMHIGGDGWLKTLDFSPRSDDHFADILDGGERADGSSLFPRTGIEADASDVVLRPRPATAFLDPFAPHPTLAVLCHHLGRDTRALPQSPDTIVRRAYERLYEETGVELWGLGEVEYFLGKGADERDIYGADDRGYHATAPFVFGEDLRRDAMAVLVDMGVPVKYGHSEVGYVEAEETEGIIWEQHEIELDLAPLPDAAEGVVLTQWVLRNLAHQRGMRLSLAPIVRRGHAGSGLHFHLSPLRDGRHLGGEDEEGTLGPEARWLIGGLVRTGGALMAFGNREAGSFVRLLQGKEAPNTVTWGKYNRHALIRLPIQARTEDGRTVTPPTIEFRLPDGSCHPHLLLAGVAQAMMLGRETEDLEGLLASTEVGKGDGTEAVPVPHDFHQAAEAMKKVQSFLEEDGIFPPGFIDRTLERLEEMPSETA
ncbi:MAG: glutamine synthetase beta-grasp domain-containing protein [bacterium]